MSLKKSHCYAFGVAMILCLHFGAVAAVQGSPSTDPNQPAGVDVVPTSCELHVWPSNGLRSVFHGWTRGGIVDGAVTGREGYPVVPKDPIDASQQAALLRAADLADSVGLAGYQVIVHDTPLESRVIRTSVSRIADSSSSCYAELIADDVFLQQDIVNGTYLKSLVRFRQFGASASPENIFGTFVQTKMTAFPPKPDRPQDNQAALDELHSAYLANFDAFGAAMTRNSQSKRK
ncbi:MAG: hypothetical protein ACT6Q5_01135 [Sphingopyxis solisilvae]|uniref:hypothetical protein n=1 Tax=Sphingopyxis solisilvae TaxID=1886788 RepID=UPI00403681C0